MRKSFLSAAVLAAVLGSGFAYAEEATGKIKLIDDAAQTVTLNDGSVYSFGASTHRHDVLGGYRVGDAVSIVWTLEGDKHLIEDMSPSFVNGVEGKIAEINQEAGTVKLADHPTTYVLKSEKNKNLDLSGFKVGDAVTILPGTGNEGRAISAHEKADVMGKVKSIDTGEKTVTLDDGRVYRFDSNSDANLGGFKTGDMVKISAIRVGTTSVAQTISPAG
jgi:Cu/Ag efflux protein CusF